MLFLMKAAWHYVAIADTSYSIFSLLGTLDFFLCAKAEFAFVKPYFAFQSNYCCSVIIIHLEYRLQDGIVA